MRVDLLIRNASILTVDDARPRASSLAVHHGRVFALDPEDLRADIEIDAGGAVLVPGFGDAHNHMAWFGQGLGEVDLTGLHALDTLYDRIAERAATLPADAFVIGAGYDHTAIGGHPHRTALDRAAGGRPVVLKHRSGHVTTVNTPVLDRIGVLAGTATVPEGGVVVRDEDGDPTGTLEEQAQTLVNALLVPYPVDDLASAVGAASRVYSAEGLTHVTDCGIGGGWVGRSSLELAAYQRARANGELTVRVQLMPVMDALHPVAGHRDDPHRRGLDLGVCTGFGDEWVRVGPVKVFMDGSLVARTAAMREPFCDRHSHGYLQDDPELLRRNILDAHATGWRIAAHAIGDRAVDTLLDVFTEAFATHPRPDARPRIEHAAVTSPEQVTRMAALGVTPVPQARFLYEIGDTMAEAVGPDRAGSLYRHASFLRAGMRVPGSSDRPVAAGSPLLGMQSMVQRLTATGAVIGADERVDATTALRAYTLDAAWTAGEEHERGSLTPGKLADFVLLSDDPTAVDADRIGSIGVLATYVGGNAVHTTREWLALL
ncbi:amidohydrolase [Pseudonocardia acaciae]|uniref:amidohydrolase n=1 Tax=Pseudonocardia acaciae TaxID=551276 RepID=UPI0005640609|nr:amidohydrolase [Pseudonocardia acaciae]